MPADPFFSVVIPTYRRQALLRQAVDSVLSQTFRDFEIVISDDAPDDGCSEDYLTAICSRDVSVRVVRNTGSHGQSGNTNNGLRNARGKWAKILHDDDIMYPTCLETFHAAIERVEGTHAISLACCRSDALSSSGELLRRWSPRRSQPYAEIVPSQYAALAMYLQEDVGESLPSSICVNMKLLATRNAWMPTYKGLYLAVDTHWALLLAPIGHRLIINRSLIAKREEPSSITAHGSDQQLDSESLIIRELQYRVIPSELQPPPLHVAKQALLARRAAHRLLKKRQPLAAIRLAARAWDPRAWVLAARPLLTSRLPFIFRETPRLSVEITET